MKEVLKNATWRFDIVAWIATVTFFCISAMLNDGDLKMAFIASAGVIILMFLVGFSVEVIIEILKNIKGIGTITGFLTNLPEALVVIVGLANQNVIFANSTPLGSNYVNPIVLFLAAIVLGKSKEVWKVSRNYMIVTLLFTGSLAAIFFFIPQTNNLVYLIWLLASFSITIPLFIQRPKETDNTEDEEQMVRKIWFFPALILLVASGYFLDPVVSFASEVSSAPKGLIGFAVLSTLSSWPEFKTVYSLIQRKKKSAALLNILVSNIINLWLAGVGLILFLLIYRLF